MLAEHGVLKQYEANNTEYQRNCDFKLLRIEHHHLDGYGLNTRLEQQFNKALQDEGHCYCSNKRVNSKLRNNQAVQQAAQQSDQQRNRQDQIAAYR